MHFQVFAQEYSDELLLNAAFSHFVSAYEKAYNGPNTLQHQLGVKNKYIKDESEWCQPQILGMVADRVPQCSRKIPLFWFG